MRYCTHHKNGYRFQIRVPAAARPRYGTLIRVDLQTDEPRTAKLLSLHLAAEWLTKFAAAAAPDDPEPAPAPVPDTATDSSETLHLTAAFEYWRALTPNRPPRTLIEFERTAETFDEIVRKPLASLARRDIAHYRDTLLADGLAAATVKKHLGFVSTLLQAQYDAGHLPTNVARGLRVPRRKVPDLGRSGFTEAQLESVFASPVYSQGLRPRGGGEAAAWLPILAYATGARLEELCQLRTADVTEQRETGLLIRIHDDGKDTRVKTVSSRRIVPIHADVLAAGFPAYVALRQQRGDEWLFPDLRRDTFGNRSGNWLKWWGRYLRHPQGCNIQDPRVVFHSFRHSFKTLCRAPAAVEGDAHGGTVISEEVHDALTGHVGRTVSRQYGVVPLATLVAAMRRLKLPVRIPSVPGR